MAYKITDDCISCGACEPECPVSAISEGETIYEIDPNVCVECGAGVPLPEDVMENEILHCPDCGAELEVISLEPLTLSLAPEVEEDWGE